MRKNPGLTLAEVLVSAGMILAMTLVLWAVLSGSYTAALHGATTIEMHHRAREAMRRMLPILHSAVRPRGELEAIYTPYVGETLPTCHFVTSFDHLAGTGGGGDPPPYDPHTGRPLKLYRLLFERGEVVLERATPPFKSKVLARNLYDVGFRRDAVGLVTIIVEVREPSRDASNRITDRSYRMSSMVELPAYSIR